MIELRPGDVFAEGTEAFFGKLIRLRDKMRSNDCEATFNHCGVIVDSTGGTFESRRRIQGYNLKNCVGNHIIIVRPVAQDFSKLAAMRKIIRSYDGKAYPWYRIILHAITPTLARWLHHSGVPVCSELVAEYLYLIGVRHPNFWGTTPDTLADEWRHWREYEIIFDGTWIDDQPHGEGV